MESGGEGIVEKAIKILEKYPLCDHCLGRLFAGLGYGWANKERGDAIKRLVLMTLHRDILQDTPGSVERFARIAPNIGWQAQGLYEKLFGRKLEEKKCYICNNLMDEFIEEASMKAGKLLSLYDIARYVVGVKVSPIVEERERSIREEHNIPYGESIKAELRREIGKKLITEYRKPDFTEPEATVLIHFPTGEIELQVNSLLLKARYWKKARYISQAYWPSPNGARYFSVEQAAWGLLRLTGAERLVLHAAGREDIDARMLGSGRPAIIELKVPRRRRLKLEQLEEAANIDGRGIVEFKVEGIASRREVRVYKQESTLMRKVYKALIVFADTSATRRLDELSSYFKNRIILQRTPRRVLHRRPDILRRKRVFNVSCIEVIGGVAECLIEAEGGLYIKELVSGDNGRTNPSFSSLLGIPAECVELDVLYVGIGE